MKRIPEMPFVNHDFDGAKLVSDLCRVPDIAALQVAEFFEDAAKKLRERHVIWQREQEIRKDTISRRASITRLPGRVIDQMLNGHSFEEAATIIADEQGIPRETVYKYWLEVVSYIETTSKQRRDAKIWELYKTGLSDIQIAKAVDLSDRQVRRIIYRKKNGSDAAPEPFAGS